MLVCTFYDTNNDGGHQEKYNMAKITVKIEGGTVQTVEGIPTDVTIEVRNYDVSGVDEKVVTNDENGKSCEFASGTRRSSQSESRNRCIQGFSFSEIKLGLARHRRRC
jgi:hypothetical protein